MPEHFNTSSKQLLWLLEINPARIRTCIDTASELLFVVISYQLTPAPRLILYICTIATGSPQANFTALMTNPFYPPRLAVTRQNASQVVIPHRHFDVTKYWAGIPGRSAGGKTARLPREMPFLHRSARHFSVHSAARDYFFGTGENVQNSIASCIMVTVRFAPRWTESGNLGREGRPELEVLGGWFSGGDPSQNP